MITPGSANPLLLAGGASAGFQVSRSLRFNSADSAYLNRTPSVAGNRKTWTWSGWVKRSKITSGDYEFIFGYASGSTYEGLLWAAGSDKLEFWSSPAAPIIQTTQLFRDPSAWFHIVLACDTTQATASNRVKLYINGSQVTQLDAASYPAQDFLFKINDTVAYNIGSEKPDYGRYFNGYLANIHFIDGQALTPSSFTEVSATTGQLIPKAYSGTYGTNGFYLKFADNSTTAALGTDTSGNGNTWTVNNFAVSGVPWATSTYLSSTTNYPGYPVANGFDNDVNSQWLQNTQGGTVTFSNFSISYTSSVKIKLGGSGATVRVNGGTGQTIAANSFISVASGSGTLTSLSWQANGSEYPAIYGIQIDDVLLVAGVPGDIDSLVDTPTSYGTDTGVGGEVRGNYCTWNPLATGNLIAENGNLAVRPTSDNWQQIKATMGFTTGKWYWECTVNPSTTYANQYHGISNSLESPTTNLGTVSGFCYGRGGDKYAAGVNTAGAGSAYVAGDTIGMAMDLDSGTQTIKFYRNGSLQYTQTISGNGPWHPASNCYYAQSPAVFDSNFGQRAFAYPVSGYKALVDTNIPVVVAKPNTVFDAVLYSGNNSTQSITSLAFNPDMVWSKCRNVGRSHRLSDAIRGSNVDLYTDTTASDNFYGTGSITAFTANGFNLDNSASSQYNTSGETYVSWAWDAGTSTVPNTQGSITSQVRANATAGFSVITYTGTGTAGATVGHGLGIAPGMIITKSRSNTSDWDVYHKGLATPASQRLELQSTAAVVSSASDWNYTNPSSTVVTLGTSYSGNFSGYTHVMYAFAPVSGYSAMGSYVASSGLPFVYLGFRPRYLLIKNVSSGSTSWRVIDSARDTYNDGSGAYWLKPNASDAEVDERPVDLLSNGFKLRMTDGGDLNYSSDTYIYFAVAENPFQYARAR
jgi:hypothetical protein